MEESIGMTLENSIQTIEKFPVDTEAYIVYVVYNEDMVSGTESLISEVHGRDYTDKYVTVVAMNDNWSERVPVKSSDAEVRMYFDPTVFKYRGNGYN
jgi:hypothetical protein